MKITATRIVYASGLVDYRAPVTIGRTNHTAARARSRNIARSKATFRSPLLLAVNVPLAALVAFFLAYDYSRELAQRLEDKQIALVEEAQTVLPAVLQVRHHGSQSVQEYIDTACGRMQDANSPGHHIAVELGDETFQALAHHRGSPEMLLAMQMLLARQTIAHCSARLS